MLVSKNSSIFAVCVDLSKVFYKKERFFGYKKKKSEKKEGSKE